MTINKQKLHEKKPKEEKKSETEETLRDLYPDSKIIKLNRGKHLVIGNLNLDHMLWIEKKYGTFDKFREEMNTDSLSEKIDLLFLIAENEEDFEDKHDLARHIPMKDIYSIIDVLSKVLADSMPSRKQAADNGEAKGKK